MVFQNRRKVTPRRFELRDTYSVGSPPSSGKCYDKCGLVWGRHWFYLVMIFLFVMVIFVVPPVKQPYFHPSAALLRSASLSNSNYDRKVPHTSKMTSTYKGKNMDTSLYQQLIKHRYNGANTLQNDYGQSNNADSVFSNKKKALVLLEKNEDRFEYYRSNQSSEKNKNENDLDKPSPSASTGMEFESDNEILNTYADILQHHIPKKDLSNPNGKLMPKRCLSSFASDTTMTVLNVEGCGLESLPNNLCHILPNLQEIDISFNPGLQNVQVLQNCQYLRVLKANGILHPDLTVTFSEKNLQNLIHLEWRFNGISGQLDLSSLPPNLMVLSLSHNKITSIVASSLESIPSQMHFLQISHNQISSLDGLNCLQELRLLRLSHNMISSTQIVVDLLENSLPNLIWISVTGNPFYKNEKQHQNLPIHVPTIGSSQLTPMLKRETESSMIDNTYYYFQGKPVKVQVLDSQSPLYTFFHTTPQTNLPWWHAMSNGQVDGSDVSEQLMIHASIGMRGAVKNNQGCMAILTQAGIVLPAFSNQENNEILEILNLTYVLTSINTFDEVWSILHQVVLALDFLHTEIGVTYGNLRLQDVLMTAAPTDANSQIFLSSSSLEFSSPCSYESPFKDALQKVEVRSFGHFVEEMLKRIEINDLSQENAHLLQKLLTDCMLSRMSTFQKVLASHFSPNSAEGAQRQHQSSEDIRQNQQPLFQMEHQPLQPQQLTSDLAYRQPQIAQTQSMHPLVKQQQQQQRQQPPTVQQIQSQALPQLQQVQNVQSQQEQQPLTQTITYPLTQPGLQIQQQLAPQLQQLLGSHASQGIEQQQQVQVPNVSHGQDQQQLQIQKQQHQLTPQVHVPNASQGQDQQQQVQIPNVSQGQEQQVQQQVKQ